MGSPSEVRGQQGARLSGDDKERYVESLFDRIASPYDRLNRIISMGRDRAWRRRVVELAAVPSDGRVIDLGTGTGDLALEFARTLGADARVVGIDLSGGMLARAVEKSGGRGTWMRGKADAIPFPDDWADAISMAWVLRNVKDREGVYREVQRVLKPGGRFLCVDMSRPRSAFARAGFWGYRHLAMPVLVRLCGGDKDAYHYLASSTDHFPDGPALAEELREVGFVDVSYKALMTGAVAIHRCVVGG